MRVSLQKNLNGTETKLGWLIERADYLALQARDKSVSYNHTPFFTLQVRPMVDTNDKCDWRVGLTTSKRVGNAVARNRARRRLRDLARRHVPLLMQPGYDLVLVGRTPAARAPFPLLIASLETALDKLQLRRKAEA